MPIAPDKTKLYPRNLIELLLKLQWWNWDEQKIVDHLELLVAPNDIVTVKTLLKKECV